MGQEGDCLRSLTTEMPSLCHFPFLPFAIVIVSRVFPNKRPLFVPVINHSRGPLRRFLFESFLLDTVNADLTAGDFPEELRTALKVNHV